MWFLLSFWLILGAMLDGQDLLESAPRLTLYSLSPDATPRQKLDQKKTFHGYLIRRTVDIKGEAKTAVLGKLYSAIAEKPEPARCFIPRHGIRATSGNRTIDLVICFECKQFKSYVDGKEGGGTLGESAQKAFNDALTSPSGTSRTPSPSPRSARDF